MTGWQMPDGTRWQPSRRDRRVLAVFLTGCWVGVYDIMRLGKVTSLRSFRVIDRLEDLGWVIWRQETVPPGEGRPPRRLRTLTAFGRKEVAAALGLSEVTR